jgi:two-component system response regulator HydG
MLGRLAFIDRDHSEYDRLSPALRGSGFDVTWMSNPDELMAAVEAGEIDVVITGLELDGTGGLELCHQVSISRPDVRCIVVGSEGTYDTALAALRAGAFDFFVKPMDSQLLDPALHRALQHRSLQDEVRRLRTALAEATHFEELIGMSPPMLKLYELLEQAASSNASVLIAGESGTGKELVARALHNRSKRRDGPFVAVNCSAIPDNLLESELFGHVKGAFTDAKVARSGLFVKAAGGTLFLDEIGDMPLSLQPKLLRALQERTVRPVGGDVEIPFDARVIAATNTNLEALVAEKLFREDLYYRINVIQIDVPPLRDRSGDIVLLAQHYAEHYALLNDKAVLGLSPAAAERVVAYPWPGNVRELQNCIERAVALTREEQIAINDLPEKIRRHTRNHVLVVSSDPADLVPMEEVERRYILRVMAAVDGNKREAARILGFDRKTLYRKLSRYGIEVSRSAS